MRSSDRLGLAEVEVEGVPHAPGRVGRRDVEGLEVVPVGLDLGALGHRRSPCRRRRPRARRGSGTPGGGGPARRAGAESPGRLGEVEAVGLHLGGPLGDAELGPARLERRPRRRVAGLVQPAARPPCGPRGRATRGSRCARARATSCPRRRRLADLLECVPAVAWRRERVASASTLRGSSESSVVVRCRRRVHGGIVEPAGRSPPWRRRRWRSASKHSTAADTPTLSDSARPAIGIVTARRGRRPGGVEPAGLVAEHQGGRARASRPPRSRVPPRTTRGDHAPQPGGAQGLERLGGGRPPPPARGTASRPWPARTSGCRGRPCPSQHDHRVGPGGVGRCGSTSRGCPGRARRRRRPRGVAPASSSSAASERTQTTASSGLGGHRRRPPAPSRRARGRRPARRRRPARVDVTLDDRGRRAPSAAT